MKNVLLIACFLLISSLSSRAQNLLSGKYSKDELAKILISQQNWVPFPKITDRAGWAKADPEMMKAYVKKAESYLNYEWPSIPATKSLLIERTGDRDEYQKISFDDMHDESLDVSTKGGWTAMIQHYFASAWIPPAEQENHFYTKELKDGRYVIGTYSPPVTVEANTEAQFVSRLFAGPKIQPMMEKISTGLELTVDYSVLTFIGKPIYWLLNKIHNVIGNWGVAIIGVTLCIKLLFFPLSQASFKSMAKMRKIQPRLKELQERFADDRPRFNNEMMALYKKEKVNPLGGCLPILIQIPVFMALYWVLSETVEFRQAPFMLWIQDLSIQDPFFILPLIMGVTMKIQQGLNPAPIDPIQAKVMKMFPIVFTIFFLFFPAGLVLYWVVNNTLSIIQQTYITKQIEKAK